MKKIMTLAVGLLLTSSAFAQKVVAPAQYPALKDVMGKYFLIGAAVNTDLPA